MELIKNGKGQTLQLDKGEAEELKYLIEKALMQGKAESDPLGFFDWVFDIPTEVEITDAVIV